MCLHKPVRSGETGEEFSSPNNLLKLVDLVSGKAVKAKVVGMTIQTHTHSKKLPKSIKNAIFF